MKKKNCKECAHLMLKMEDDPCKECLRIKNWPGPETQWCAIDCLGVWEEDGL